MTRRFPRLAKARAFAIVLTCAAHAAYAAEKEPAPAPPSPTPSASPTPADLADPWAGLRALVGRWSGTVSGEPGEGAAEREYRFVLGGRFLRLEGRDVYPARAGVSKGEVREETALFSHDREHGHIVLRQFHADGNVYHFTAAPPARGAREWSLVSENIENVPPGWRARETWQLGAGGELVERFELQAPGKDFQVYAESRLHLAAALAPLFQLFLVLELVAT